MKDIVIGIIGTITTLAVIYALYWIAKNGSYFFFYESMVQDTIRELVKSGALK